MRDISLASTQKELMDTCDDEKLDILSFLLGEDTTIKLDWNNLNDQILDVLIVLTSSSKTGNDQLKEAITKYQQFLTNYPLYRDPELMGYYVDKMKTAFRNAISNHISEFQQILISASKEAQKRTNIIKNSSLISRRDASKFNKMIEANENEPDESN